MALPAAEWRIHRLLGREQLGAAVAELLPRGTELRSVDELGDAGERTERAHHSVEFTALVTDPDGANRTLRLTARGLPLGQEPPTAPEDLGVVDGILIAGRAEQRILAEGG